MAEETSRNELYLKSLACHLEEHYRIRPVSITPAKRGYYGETWKVRGRKDAIL